MHNRPRHDWFSARFHNSEGFTLAEMAIVILITGLMLTAAASITLPIMHKARRIETDQKMAEHRPRPR